MRRAHVPASTNPHVPQHSGRSGDTESMDATTQRNRLAILIEARAASARGDERTAARLFASVGISYFPGHTLN